MDKEQTWCPSGDAGAPEAVVLGVRSGENGRLVYLADPVPASAVLDRVPEGVEPGRVMRFASHCVSECKHRRGNDCTLVERISAVPGNPEQERVPRCHLRGRCTWWAQTGAEGCRRCPVISTRNTEDDELAALVADPDVTVEQVERWIENHRR
ncbi:hypothetical protein [Nocardiopsis sp. LOL_012]|uniref:hypothetical protein n=1 Tax=Nocardiopsis sp. LOL_012 TaxID=3345409 RepID=UPI003A8B0FED